MAGVDVPGLLKNILNEGHTPWNALNECLQNMLSAGATTLVVTLEANRLLLADNGRGMTEEGLRRAYVLHGRTEATSERHGRFGVGVNNAVAIFTQNKQDAITISRTESSDTIYHVRISYRQAIQSGTLEIVPQEVSRTSEQHWEKYSIDKDKPGTLQIFDCDPCISDELRTSVRSPEYPKNLQLHLAKKYHHVLRNGVTLTLIVEGRKYPIVSVDPLARDHKDIMYPMTKVIRVLQGDGKVHFSFVHHEKQTIREMNPETGKRKYNYDLPTTLTQVGSITIRGTYCNDWVALFTPVLTEMNIKLPDNKWVAHDMLGGIVIERNGIINDTFPVERPKCGDFSERSVYVDSHISVEFAASEFMDDLFKVRTNKSKLDENNIHPELREIMDYMHKEYKKENYKKVHTSIVHIPPKPAEPTLAAPPKPAIVPTPAVSPRPTPVALPKPAGPPPKPAGPPPKPTHVAQPVPLRPAVPTKLVVPPPKSPEITYTHNDSEIMVHVGVDIHKIQYVGQYHVWHNLLVQTHAKVGTPKFIEWITELKKINRLLV